MPKSRPPYPAEFRHQMVDLFRSGRGPDHLARFAGTMRSFDVTQRPGGPCGMGYSRGWKDHEELPRKAAPSAI